MKGLDDVKGLYIRDPKGLDQDRTSEDERWEGYANQAKIFESKDYLPAGGGGRVGLSGLT
jgi:hypothetical protein